MCLAKVYIGNDQDKKLLMEEIASLRVEGDRLRIKTLFGEQRDINASIKEIDFMGSTVVLEDKKG